MPKKILITGASSGIGRALAYELAGRGYSLALESRRAEVIRRNIHVTVLYPGYIDTPLNNMLPKRPFVISVEKGATLIADMIERKVKSSTVPVWPWCIVGRMLKLLPASVVAKF
jgi:short-subunit dehydrogenase